MGEKDAVGMKEPDVSTLLDDLWDRLRREGFSTTVTSSSSSRNTGIRSRTSMEFGQVLTREKLERYVNEREAPPHDVKLSPDLIVTPAAREYAREQNLELRPS